MSFNKLANLDVSEISLVDRAANKRRFLLLKARGPGGGTKVGKVSGDPIELDAEMREEDETSERIEKAIDEKKLKAAVGAVLDALAGAELSDKASKALGKLAELAGLEFGYGYGYPEPEKTKAEKSLLDRIRALVSQHGPEKVRKAGEDLEAAFETSVKVNNINNAIWQLQDVIRDILRDNEGDKIERIRANLDAFQRFVVKILERDGIEKALESIEKAGRKISAARLAKLRETHQSLVNLASALAELIQEAETIGTEGEDATVTKEELEKFKTEEFAPAVSEVVQKALGPLEERLAKLEKTLQDTDVNETVKKALEPLAARVDTLEKSRSVSQSIPNETVAKAGGTFTGVLFGRK